MSKYIECPICKNKANLLYTESCEYIYCNNCRRNIFPEEQIRILRKEVEKDVK